MMTITDIQDLLRAIRKLGWMDVKEKEIPQLALALAIEMDREGK